MVTIQKGQTILTVTQGAYTNLYKPLGYTITNDQNTQLSGFSYDNDQAIHTDDCDMDGEKPVSEMSARELRDYANRLGLNINGINGKKELRKAILQAIR